MQKFIKRATRFVRSEDGPTTVEYGVMLAVIVAVCLLAIGSVGTKTNSSFSTTARVMGT